ncbi:adenylyl cyclase X E-like isoform X1 [Drosophila subpulchrella]|uniref:adenylyl cyclase X E-like isoform X1 n=2 Tax=Drosophila subpulchrella TaxID=1486046 RepID=UPI0018A1820B|nr:adenylyl cyclase X E-like isoform X1 [Drosophila subpulchrella]
MNFDQNKSTKAPFKSRRLRPCHIDYTEERLWEPSYLRAKCKELGLEEEYKRYQIRLMISNLSVFYVLLIFLGLTFLAVQLVFVERTEGVFVDMMSRQLSFVVVMIFLSVNFCENFVSRHRWVMILSSALSAYVVLIGDLGHNAYHYYTGGWQLTAKFDVFVLCMIYMFMPIPSIRGAALLATSVSLIYITYFLMYSFSFNTDFDAASADDYDDISVDILHNVGFNMMGIFFRIMNETMVRASFLDRHQFIMEEKWLRHALRQESMLLDSILPPQIAKPIQDSIKNKIKQNENESDRFSTGGSWRRETFMAIQIHPDVSILYADVVNYTHLTTTLTVGNLVKILHDLYGRFDMAASTFNVQRIKFLGDCYYCVAGLTTPDPDHAKCAVSLGLSMIANIQEVRAERKLDIDMRIGVHSGSLLAGVIGEAKLQFDIWGADVEIASRLEATGRPGFVHVSGRTLSNLNPSDYTIMSGTETARNDPMLESMSTYLLTDRVNRKSVVSTLEGVLSASSLDFKPVETVRSQRTSHMSMNEELREDFRNMPVGGFDFHSLCCRQAGDDTNEKTQRDIGLFCAAFKDKSLEWNYMHQPDFIWKSSVLLAWGIGCCLIYIQLVTNNFACPVCIVVDLIAFLFLTSLLCIAWFKKFCWWKSGHNEFKLHSKYSCIVFHLFEKIQHSATLRICAYFLIIISYYSVISLIMIDCDRDLFQLSYIESKLFHYEMKDDVCFTPWSFTNMISLILGVSYTFARIPFALKIFVSCCEAVAFVLIVFFQFAFNFQHSATTIPFMKAEVSHCLRVCMMLATMYAKERQSEFNTKMNYKLNVDLQNKQKAADVTNQSIVILLNNILPSHVVNLYLNSLAKHQLYYENYQMVSVMFAMLINFPMNLASLRVLNEIITEFDRLLTAYREYHVVEKIKVVGCTYMAACGLDFNLASNIRQSSHFRNSSLHFEVEQARTHRTTVGTTEDNYNEDVNNDEVVFMMTTFALDLMRTLSACNRAHSNSYFERSLSSAEICIGISSGEIMAGVVGASQPHYDIWGNPVNMASRMESTGLPGHIQVTEESAKILQEFDILCIYRGMTFVKGRGEIPTYFVGIDENLKFMSAKLANHSWSRRFSVMSSLTPNSQDTDSSVWDGTSDS